MSLLIQKIAHVLVGDCVFCVETTMLVEFDLKVCGCVASLLLLCVSIFVFELIFIRVSCYGSAFICVRFFAF